MSDKFYANDTPAQLLARLTNYEEGMGDAIKELATSEDPVVQGAIQMLVALMRASGQEHLAALRQFEESTAAIIAFKNRVLESLCKAGCPACGYPDGHAPDCLVTAALRVHPHTLPQVKEHVLVSLGLLRDAVAKVVPSLEDTDPVRQELVDALQASPIPDDLYRSH